MQLATSTNIYFNRPDGTKGRLSKCLEYCARAGFQRVDLSFLDYANFRFPFVEDTYMSWIEEARKLALELGIVFSQGHAPFYNFCDDRAPGREEQDKLVLRSIDCAAELGIPWLAIHAGTDESAEKYREASKRKNLEYFLPVVEYAEKKNVGIAFENLWDLNIAPRRRYTADVEDLVDLVDAFHCDHVGVCYDVEHAVISGRNPVSELEVIGHRLRSTHISDCIDIQADHLLPFYGITDWAPFMKKLGQMGYDGDIAFEIHRYTQYMPDPLVPAAAAHAKIVGDYLLSLAEK